MPVWLWIFMNAVQALFTLAWSALWMTVALLIVALGWRRRPALVMARRIWAPGLLRGAGARLEVSGRKHLEGLGGALFVSNHQSIIDICALFIALPIEVRFLAKRELAYVPFLGWYMAATGMVFVERGKGVSSRTAIRRVVDVLQRGQSVVSFPEGTRGQGEVVRPFKGGSFLAALEAGAPVVPIGIRGARAVLPPGGFRVRPGVITLRIGAPIATRQLHRGDRQALADEVHRCVQELMRPEGVG